MLLRKPKLTRGVYVGIKQPGLRVRKFEFASHGHHRDFKIRGECDLGLLGTRNELYPRWIPVSKNRGSTSSRGYVSYGFAIAIMVVMGKQAQI